MEIKLNLSTAQWRELYDTLSTFDFNRIPDDNTRTWTRHILTPIVVKLARKALDPDTRKKTNMKLKEAEARAMTYILLKAVSGDKPYQMAVCSNVIQTIDQTLV